MERKESKTKEGAEKQELVGVSGLTLDFLLSSKILMSGSRAQLTSQEFSLCQVMSDPSVCFTTSQKLCKKKKNPEPGKIE